MPTIVNRVDSSPTGVLQIRMKVDGGTWHRTTIEPGQDIDAQMAAVDAHLAAMGKEPVADAAPVKDRAAAVWTREKVEAHREKMAAAIGNPADRQKYRDAFLKPEHLHKFPSDAAVRAK